MLLRLTINHSHTACWGLILPLIVNVAVCEENAGEAIP